MISSRAFFGLILLLVFGAFGIRSVDIGNRPMHGDEAVHAEKFRELWEKGVYHYDSNEYHGPTIYYAALPSIAMHGRKTWADTRVADYRLPIAVFGAATLLLLAPLVSGLGRWQTLCAALFIAISPAFVFYSRYFIQEVPFVFFTLGMIMCGWRYTQTRSLLWLVSTGISAGLMIATKETAVLSFFAMFAAVALTSLLTKRGDADRSLNLKSIFPPRAIGIATLAAVIVACLFISGFGSNIRGPVDYLRAYLPWFHRAQGASIQNHPFGYYLEILAWTHKPHGGVWTEGLILILAAIGLVSALNVRGQQLAHTNPVLWRFIALYTVVLTLVYSVIPYKTPWCLLSFLLGMCLLAGLGAVVLVKALPGPSMKVVALLLLAAASTQLANQAYRASFISNADPHNPYVYAATAQDVVNLEKRLDDLAKDWPEHQNMVIKVFATSNYYWPLPWYLRHYPNVGYYSHAPVSREEASAAVTLCDSQLDDEMSALLNDTDLMNGMNEVRSGVFYEVFIRMDVWTTYLNAKNGGVTRKFVPPPEEK